MRDRAGRPIRGARCELRSGVPGGGFCERAPLATQPATASTLTDADGRFRIGAAAGYWSLRVEGAGFARWERDHLLAGDELHVRLDPLVRLIVAVLDAAGSPLQGAEVVARPAGASTPEDWRCRLRTDARGVAETLDLGPGCWRLAVRHPEHAAAVVPLEIPAGLARVVHEIRLERGARLVGSVRTAEGTPISGASLRAESPYRETFLVLAARSDETGRYATEPLFTRGETLEVLVSAPGYAAATRLIGIRPAEIEAGEAVHDFVLERSGVTLRGRAVTGAGTGVARASVRVAAIDLTGLDPGDASAYFKGTPSAPWLWQEAARTDSTGSFEVEGLSSYHEHALMLLDEGHAPRLLWSPPSAPGTVHDFGEIALVAHGGLFGRAVFDDGTPAEGERISIARTSRVYVTEIKELGRWRPDAWFHVLEAVAGEDGTFRFDRLAPGEYQILPSTSEGAEVLPGRATGPIDVLVERVRPPGPGIVITGVVRNPAGQAIPMVFVRAFALESAGERFATACLAFESGAFSLQVFPGTIFRVTFSDLRGIHEDRELRLDPARETEPLAVVLEPRALPLPPIDGLVFGPRGAPFEGATVALHPPEDSLCDCITFTRKTDATGTFRFSVAEGPHRLVASHPGHGSATYAPAWPGDHVWLDLEER